MDEKLKACKNCRWFGPIDSYFLTYGMCRKHMKTVHMNFVCDDWEPLWGTEKEKE
ncbi:hypothetical protein [Thermococcus sp. AM4]|uniref:hypothetical protein n=1 Tax=Thermococcus sp. (strain AM4) TaxID=246969 RepID=UPI0001870DA0|nr:hypothetical protein [Thermococcus sp. AM4]EEB74276.1 hypothetical protein TAM4_1643 [Thermococcus sp. AM4]